MSAYEEKGKHLIIKPIDPGGGKHLVAELKPYRHQTISKVHPDFAGKA